jgi:hypothetical protein
MDPKKKKLNWEFITKMAEEMGNGNQDGIGYTAVTKDGAMFGERWLFNWQAFHNRNKMSKPKVRNHSVLDPLKAKLKDFIELEDEPNYEAIEQYNNFGTVTEDACAITLHTRYATSPKGLANTHPFVDLEKDVSVIHNGSIRNHEKADEIRSTCDSERVLNKYIEHEVDVVPADVQNMVDELKGYFACGILAKDGDNKRVLDVFRTTAQLSAAFIKELNCLVISTSLDDIKKVVFNMQLTIISKAGSIKEDTFQRFDAVTGVPLLTFKYKDTTKWDNTPTRYSSDVDGYYDGYGQFHETPTPTALEISRKNWQERQDAMKARIAADALKKDNLIYFPPTNIQPPPVLDYTTMTGSQISEVVELRKAGMTDEEIKEALTYKDREKDKVVLEVALDTLAEVEKAKEIIKRNVGDPLNESDAILDGYALNDTKDIWLKKNNKLN